MMRYYRCPLCGDFDDYRKDSDILQTCPKCNNHVTQQLGLSFKLIGPGFYSNDFAEVNNA